MRESPPPLSPSRKLSPDLPDTRGGGGSQQQLVWEKGKEARDHSFPLRSEKERGGEGGGS